MKTECLVIGDLNIDLILNQIEGFPKLGKEILSKYYSMEIGGSGGIFSAVLSRLGIRTAIISKIGKDFYGKFILKELKKNCVDTGRLIVDKKATTDLTISLSYKKGKSQISQLDLIKNIKSDEIYLENLDNIKHIHFSSYFMMEGLKDDYVKMIKLIKKINKNISFSLDTNDDPSNLWNQKIFKILAFIDILFLNKKEALQITRESTIKSAVVKLNNYLPIVIIKLGSQGFLAISNGKIFRGFCKNLENKNFKDGTGSGDNFDAAFVYGFLKGYDIKTSLEFANFCAEKSIEYCGGVGTNYKFNEIISGF